MRHKKSNWSCYSKGGRIVSRHQKPIRQLKVAKGGKMEERSEQPRPQIHVSTDESTESSGQVSQDSYSENTSLTRYRRPSSVDGISNREGIWSCTPDSKLPRSSYRAHGAWSLVIGWSWSWCWTEYAKMLTYVIRSLANDIGVWNINKLLANERNKR